MFLKINKSEFSCYYSIMFLIQYKICTNSKGVPEGSPFELSYLVILITIKLLHHDAGFYRFVEAVGL